MALTQVRPEGLGFVNGKRNLIINGAMQVAQRSTSLTVGDSTEYKTLDRYAIGINGTTDGRATMSQSTDAPAGFGYSMKFDVTTADTSIGSGESFGVFQRIEGQNVQHINKGTSSAKKCVFSFYAKGTAKKYITEFRDDNGRQVSATFDVTTSWQRFEIEVPADTSGTIDNDNTAGFLAMFWIHAGSDYTSGTLNTSWGTSTNANRMVGCESIFSSTDNEFYITGIQLEVGTNASDFEHESYGETLQKCERYFQRFVAGANYTGFSVAFSTSATSAKATLKFNGKMRAAPTITQSNTGFNYGGQVAFSSFNTLYTGLDTSWIDMNIGSVGSAGQLGIWNGNNNGAAYVQMSAEL